MNRKCKGCNFRQRADCTVVRFLFSKLQITIRSFSVETRRLLKLPIFLTLDVITSFSYSKIGGLLVASVHLTPHNKN